MRRRSVPEQEAIPILPEKLLNDQAIMARLGVSRSKLHYLMVDEGLPHYKIGRILRFNPDEVALWLQARKRSA